jgi:putative nucleotidyltransferase with HDIG domain
MPPERILVVDDEESVRGVVAALLERSGYSATMTESAEEAIARLQQDPDYDLVLSDIMMPGTDGLTLLDHICTDHPGMPVVMFSAIDDFHVVTNAFRRGAIDYLLKPFERAELESIVMRAVEHGRLRKQNTIYRQNLESIVSARTGRLRSTMQDLERSYDITLEAMGDALDLRDEETEGHSRRVTAYTIALAKAMGLDSDELRVIARGAFLHDIGKIATPDSILLKPGKLKDQEMAIMKEHCERGYQMVRKIPFLREAAEIVYAHQVRWHRLSTRAARGRDSPWSTYLHHRRFAGCDDIGPVLPQRNDVCRSQSGDCSMRRRAVRPADRRSISCHAKRNMVRAAQGDQKASPFRPLRKPLSPSSCAEQTTRLGSQTRGITHDDGTERNGD